MKKSNIIPLLLLIYLAVMSAIGYPRFQSGEFSPLFYFGLIALTLGVIYLLRLHLKYREKLRAAREAQPSDIR